MPAPGRGAAAGRRRRRQQRQRQAARLARRLGGWRQALSWGSTATAAAVAGLPLVLQPAAGAGGASVVYGCYAITRTRRGSVRHAAAVRAAAAASGKPAAASLRRFEMASSWPFSAAFAQSLIASRLSCGTPQPFA